MPKPWFQYQKTIDHEEEDKGNKEVCREEEVGRDKEDKNWKMEEMRRRKRCDS